MKEIAKQINEDYLNERVVLCVVLKGAFPFASDLLRFIEGPIEITFVQINSYKGTEREALNVQIDVRQNDILNRHVVIVEDIVDSGSTIIGLKQILTRLGAKSVKVASAFCRNENEPLVDYCIESGVKGFLIGYGMDYNEDYRNLRDVWQYYDANSDPKNNENGFSKTIPTDIYDVFDEQAKELLKKRLIEQQIALMSLEQLETLFEVSSEKAGDTIIFKTQIR